MPNSKQAEIYLVLPGTRPLRPEDHKRIQRDPGRSPAPTIPGDKARIHAAYQRVRDLPKYHHAERRELGSEPISCDWIVIYPQKRRTIFNQNGTRLKKTGVTFCNTEGQSSTSSMVRDRLKSDLVLMGSYRKVGRYYGVSGAMVWRIINQDYEPKTSRIRRALGYQDPAEVFSIDGDIPHGTVSIGALICQCGQPFISNHPRRKRCFICSPFRGKRR